MSQHPLLSKQGSTCSFPIYTFTKHLPNIAQFEGFMYEVNSIWLQSTVIAVPAGFSPLGKLCQVILCGTTPSRLETKKIYAQLVTIFAGKGLSSQG